MSEQAAKGKVKAKDIKGKGSLFIFKEENSHQNVPYII